MTLQKLICFVQVADCLNFSEAARVLHIAQPSLSRQIVGLEDELGLKLFERNTRKVTLTPAGRVLAQEAREVVRRAEGLHVLAKRLGQGYAGKLRVGYSSAMDGSLVSQLLREISTFQPRVELQLHRLNQGRLISSLRRGEIDIALLFRGGLVEQSELKVITLTQSELSLVVSESHKLAGRESIEVEELKGVPLTVMERSESAGAHDRFLALCQRHGISAEIDRASDDPQVALLSAVLGEEATVIPVIADTTIPGATTHMPFSLVSIPLMSNGKRIVEDVVIAYDGAYEGEAMATFLSWARRFAQKHSKTSED